MPFIQAENLLERQKAMQQQNLTQGIGQGLQNAVNAYQTAQERQRALAAQQAQQENELAKEQRLFEQQRGLKALELQAAQENKLADREFAKSMADQKFEQDKILKRMGSVNKPQQYDIEDRTTITALATKNANANSIKNNLDSFLANAANYTPDQLLTQGRQLIKTLNSSQGQDAVGAEEAKRLAGKLEFAVGNFTNSNPTQFGRDLPGFIQQVKDTSDILGQTVIKNQEFINKAKGVNSQKSEFDEYQELLKLKQGIK